MSVVVAASVATDHLMTYDGQFVDALDSSRLDHLSVSFLASDLEIRRGGVGANICFALGVLGQQPVLVAAVGSDFAEYRAWLEKHGVDCDSVHVSDTRHTARFVCTTDATHAQIATFYPGAMSESRDVSILPVAERLDDLTHVLIGADDPDGMRRHTRECRDAGIPFIADPSQQLPSLDPELVRELIDGAAMLFSNEFESGLIADRTGWTAKELRSRVGTVVTTLGKNGVRIHTAGEVIEVPGIEGVAAVDPTGAGDSFRGGFLAAVGWGVSMERAAQVGCTLAAYVVETVGTQEYSFTAEEFVTRLSASYGDDAGAEVAKHLA